MTIIGNKAAPAASDSYLARFGYDSQQTSEPEDPERPDNLWHPVDGDRDFGAHGRFGSRARQRSPQTWLTEHRSTAVMSALAATAAVVAAKAIARSFRMG
jgi:hypothetical protein